MEGAREEKEQLKKQRHHERKAAAQQESVMPALPAAALRRPEAGANQEASQLAHASTSMRGEWWSNGASWACRPACAPRPPPLSQYRQSASSARPAVCWACCGRQPGPAQSTSRDLSQIVERQCPLSITGADGDAAEPFTRPVRDLHPTQLTVGMYNVRAGSVHSTA